MPRGWTWHRPSRLDEAVGLLLEHGADAVLIAGGTAVALNPPRRDRQVMIDLQGLEALKGLDEEGEGLKIGAMVTAQGLIGSDEARSVGRGLLREVGLAMGPRPVRNRVTVGGNVMQVFRWCDLPVALSALGARFQLYGPGGALRQLTAEELFEAQPRRALKPGELLGWVLIDRDRPGRGAGYEKLTMTAVEHSLATAAAELLIDAEGRCSRARVVVGALATLPQRVEAAERALEGEMVDAEALKEASASLGDVQVNADRRADEAYRREVAGVLVRRALEKALARAKLSLKDGGGAC